MRKNFEMGVLEKYYMENIDIVMKIFKHCGYEIVIDSSRKIEPCLVDFEATKDGQTYGIEVKLSTSFNWIRVVDILYSYCEKTQNKVIMVILNVASDELKNICNKYNIELIDIANILSVININSTLYSELVSRLSYSINLIVPQENSLLINETLEHNNIADSLIKEYELISSGKKDFVKYEDWCFNALIYIFDDKLALWDRQEKSNNNLYRFDLLCRIKDDEKDTFWRMLVNHFQSKYVIFEFKNYSEKIKQEQIYTTEKYLYKKALRAVAFIVAKNGFDKNSEWAAKGCLRENGKLILLLDSTDVKKMINMKEMDKNPSDYLLSKLDKLLAELEK